MEIKTIDLDFSVCKVNDVSNINLKAEYCFIGKTDEESLASIRLTFNHTLNQNQADYCIDCIKKNVAALRKIKND